MPDWMPIIGVAILGWILFPTITFAALRFGEIGMDIAKSLRPLVLSLNPTSANTLVKLRETREQLSFDVTELINSLGPELFPDFETGRVVADPFVHHGGGAESLMVKHSIPRSESFGNLSNIGLFASRPESRSRSRSNSGGFAVKAMSGMEGAADFESVAKGISDAMRERRRRRVSAAGQEEEEDERD